MGKGSSVDVISRSVAKDNSYQNFYSAVKGKAECFGHVACDGILVGNARIDSTPKLFVKMLKQHLCTKQPLEKLQANN